MVSCDRILVEGKTDEEILKRLGYAMPIQPLGGKGNVLKKFLDDINNDMKRGPLNVGNVCYLVDGDDEGYGNIYDQVVSKLRISTRREPPYIKFCFNGKSCRILIVVGDKVSDYKGCIESMLLEQLKLDENGDVLVTQFVEYKATQGKMDLCGKSKLSLYLKVILKADDIQAIYLNRNFVEELFRQFPQVFPSFK
ncbi:hypothetical protein L3N51_01291 [Metallosphaera sp. J1]|uniref:hypothetical protein n=1 Tax=Metallosphaera javensis (ex Hofmann et al. 2022) TaxID=99938 RepID=UPI001EDFCEB1|nr:hypothetical protein [Metallosphaera javensis (ex Hofmann et al. 2022)]MCG3109001.1 hypothetical protein [Metallosphaera javensis (ex Hofmann et al. 2022)]